MAQYIVTPRAAAEGRDGCGTVLDSLKFGITISSQPMSMSSLLVDTVFVDSRRDKVVCDQPGSENKI